MARIIARHSGLRLGMAVAAVGLLTSGCFGPFHLTRRLYQWNTQVGEDKWERELVFLLLALSPVYSFTTLADAVVFNAMEFWTGNNPVGPSDPRRSEAPQIKRLVRGPDEVVLHCTQEPHQRALTLELFHNGALTRTLHFERRTGEATLAKDAKGLVLLSARALTDGGIVVNDRDGNTVAVYSAPQVEQGMELARADR